MNELAKIPGIKEKKEEALILIHSELKNFAKQINKDGDTGHYNWQVKAKIRSHIERIVLKVHELIKEPGNSSEALFHFDDCLRNIDIKINERLNASIGLYFNERKHIEVGVGITSARGKEIMHLEASKGYFTNKVYIQPAYSETIRLKPGIKMKKGKPVKLMTGIAIPISPIFNAQGFVVWEAVIGDKITHIEEHPPFKGEIDP